MLLRHFIFPFLFFLLVNGEISDYCTYCKGGTHTMCKYPKSEPGQNCKGVNVIGLNEKQKQELLEMHNEIRNYVASGYETRGSPGPQVEASNMKKLKWDTELAEIAQRWASQCITDINKRSDECRKTARFDVGQNTVGILTTDSSPDFRRLLADWYNQVEYVSEDDVKNFTKSQVRRIDSFTQMVWAKTEYLGCGFSSFQPQLAYDNMDRFHLHKLVCNYGPTGNTPGRSIYLIGKGCAACEECDIRFPSLCRDFSSPEDSKEVIDHFYSNFPKFFQNVKQKESFKTNKTSRDSEMNENTVSEASGNTERSLDAATTLEDTEVVRHSSVGLDEILENNDRNIEQDYENQATSTEETKETESTSTSTSTTPKVEILRAKGLWLGDRFGKIWSTERKTFHGKIYDANRSRQSSSTQRTITNAGKPVGDKPLMRENATTRRSSRLISMFHNSFGMKEEDMYKELETIIRSIQKKDDKDGSDCYCYYRISSEGSKYPLVITNIILCFIPLTIIGLI